MKTKLSSLALHPETKHGEGPVNKKYSGEAKDGRERELSSQQAKRDKVQVSRKYLTETEEAKEGSKLVENLESEMIDEAAAKRNVGVNLVETKILRDEVRFNIVLPNP